jgi:phosphotransferase system enzyme I (PtsI)
MTPRALADVASMLAGVSREECVELARTVLDCSTAQAARSVVQERLLA